MTATIDRVPTDDVRVTDPLTTGDVNAALSRLSVLRLPKIADWIQRHPDVCEWAEVDAMIRDVLDLTPWQMGYGEPDKPRTTAATRDATRTALLIRWATDPWYADTAPPDHDDDRTDE